MGFFDKFKKDYSAYDCTDRPASWFLCTEGKDAFNLYVTHKYIDMFISHCRFMQTYDSLIQTIDTEWKIDASAKNFNLKSLVQQCEKADVLAYFGPPYYFKNFINSLSLDLPRYGSDSPVKYEGQKLFFSEAVIQLMDFYNQLGYDVRYQFPMIIDADQNPVLKYLISMCKNDGEFAEEYAALCTFDDWKCLQAERLKTKIALLRYVYGVFVAEDTDVSVNEWLYCNELYFNVGEDKNGKYIEPISHEQACDIIADYVEYPDIWDSILEKYGNVIDYITKNMEKWDAAANAAYKAYGLNEMLNAIDSIDKKK